MAPTTESELLAACLDLAILRKWAVVHFRPARTADGWRTALQGHKGFPDLVLARDGVTLFRELKGSRGRVQAEQLDWARQIDPYWKEHAYTLDARIRIPFDVWRPADWDVVIVPTLTRPRVAATRTA